MTGEQHVSLDELQQGGPELIEQSVNDGTILLLHSGGSEAGEPIAVVLPMQLYKKLLEHTTAHDDPSIEARVGGVAGGLVAGAGAAIGTVTGHDEVSAGARHLGRRLGRAVAVGIDALRHPAIEGDEQKKTSDGSQ